MFIWLKHSWAVTTVVLHHIYIETWWQQSSKKFKNLIKTLIESSTDVWYDYKFLAVISVEPSVHTIKETYMYGHMREICTGVIVNEKKDKFRMDSLASINIINQCHRTQSHIKLSYKTLKIRNGEDLKSLGTTRLKVKNLKTQKKYSIEFVVVPDSVTPLIGTHSAQQLELISVHQDNLLQFHPTEAIVQGYQEDWNSWHVLEESWNPTKCNTSTDRLKCELIHHTLVSSSDCPERKVLSWPWLSEEPWSPSESGQAYNMGEQCCHCNQEVWHTEDMRRSTPFNPSPQEKNTPTDNPRWFNARTGTSEDILDCWLQVTGIASLIMNQVYLLPLQPPLEGIDGEYFYFFSASSKTPRGRHTGNLKAKSLPLINISKCYVFLV